MNGPRQDPNEADDYVVVPPAARPQHVQFADPPPTVEQEARPLRAAMFWIFLFVTLGLAWSTCTGEGETQERAPRRAPSGTTTL